jgi:competence protein ComEC
VNALSIVARLDFAGRSIFLTGDTVGRRKGDSDDECKDAEAVMVQNHASANGPALQADVMFAPHHGGDNGGAICFIRAVKPTWVIFSSGHAHRHPTKAAAGRYIANGVKKANIFRTDRGDDEKPPKKGPTEWKEGSITGCVDRAGDDDVDIVVRESGKVEVEYRQASSGC